MIELELKRYYDGVSEVDLSALAFRHHGEFMRSEPVGELAEDLLAALRRIAELEKELDVLREREFWGPGGAPDLSEAVLRLRSENADLRAELNDLIPSRWAAVE